MRLLLALFYREDMEKASKHAFHERQKQCCASYDKRRTTPILCTLNYSGSVISKQILFFLLISQFHLV